MARKGNNVSWARAKAFQVLGAWSGRERRIQLRPKITLIADKANKDSREKAFFWQLTLGVVRSMRLLDGVLKAYVKKLPPPGEARHALRLGLYQLLYMDRVPVHAAVDQSVSLVTHAKGRALVNAVLRRVAEAILPEGEVEDRAAQLALPGGRLLSPGKPFLPDPEVRKVAWLAVRHSYPDFVVKRWLGRWGMERTTAVLEAGNTTPVLNFRVCRLNATVEEVTASLVEDGVKDLRPGARPGTLQTDWAGNPANLRALREGLVTVQDQAAMHAVEQLELEPGLRVLDICSAPGGKTTQAAEAMNDEGVVFAWDTDGRRLERTADAVARLGLHSVKVLRGMDLEQVLALGPFDRVLTDVPCTSTGVLARRPEARWKLQPKDFIKLPTIQRKILEQVAPSVAEGGVIAYSTCSLEPEEDERVAASLEGWRISHQETTLPVGGLQDGSFVARLERS